MLPLDGKYPTHWSSTRPLYTLENQLQTHFSETMATDENSWQDENERKQANRRPSNQTPTTAPLYSSQSVQPTRRTASNKPERKIQKKKRKQGRDCEDKTYLTQGKTPNVWQREAEPNSQRVGKYSITEPRSYLAQSRVCSP